MMIAGTLKKDICRMFDAGVGVEEIADALGARKVIVVAVLVRAARLKPEADDLVGPEVRAAVVDAYRDWVPMQWIRKRYGLGLQEVYQILNEEGEPPRAANKVAIERRLAILRFEAEVVDMYRAGTPIADIWDLTGCGYDRQRAICHKYGVPLRQPRRRSKPCGEFHHPSDEIARLVGLLTSTNQK